ncbi:hypothetical protein CEQ90_16555 [Lewinellaceae bacterium SD302]|nr:hypothetical protein CEQ90_16555 [Lewinellaceae bacterium SD302]
MSISVHCPFGLLSSDQKIAPLVMQPSSFSIPGFSDWQTTWFNSPEMIVKGGSERYDDIWQDKNVLAMLSSQPQGVETSLLLLRHENGLKVPLTVQFFTFRPGEQVHQPVEDSATRSNWAIRRRISSVMSFKVLTIGQFMVSGKHCWTNSLTAAGYTQKQIVRLLEAAAGELARRVGGCSAILVKDAFELKDPAAVIFEQRGFYQLPVDPSMELTIRPEWNSLDDYLIDLSSKYRVRYRRSRKQLPVDLTRKTLSLNECEQYSDRMYALYNAVKVEAAFDAVDLQPCYFVSLKETLGDYCQINAYFLDGKMIGFRTTVANNGTLHAHYLGFDQEMNRTFHLYHNMLFDLLKEGIEGGFSLLDYGRTALEIKSSIGAEPREYFCGIKAVNPLLNPLISLFTPAVFRAQRWIQRNPFKAG